MCLSGPWQRVEVGAWKEHKRPIHILEAWKSLDGFVDASSYGRRGFEQPSLGDNMPEVLATDTGGGRARDRGLNTVCRVSAGLQIRDDSVWSRRHVPTARNFSDKDSRLADEGYLAPGQFFTGGALQPFLSRFKGRPLPSRAVPPPGPAFLEIFGGCCRYSGAVSQAGLRVAQPIDLAFGPSHDISDSRVLRTVLDWISAGRLWAVAIAVPCTDDSVATAGLQKTEEQRQTRERLLRAVIRIIDQCRLYRVQVSVENPRGSRLWKHVSFRRALKRIGAVPYLYDSCHHGTAYRKPQTIWSTYDLGVIVGLCRCLVPHEFLEGKV